MSKKTLSPEELKESVLASAEEIVGKSRKGKDIVVDGTKISYRELTVFDSYVRHNGQIANVAKELKMHRGTIWQYTQKPFWGKLMKLYVEPWQDNLFMGLMELTETMKQAAEQILTGTFPTPKLAMPAVQTIKLAAEMGQKRGKTIIAPLKHTVRDLYLDEETGTATINIQLTKNVVNILVKDFTEEERLNWALNGDIPERLQSKYKELIHSDPDQIEIEGE